MQHSKQAGDILLLTNLHNTLLDIQNNTYVPVKKSKHFMYLFSYKKLLLSI